MSGISTGIGLISGINTAELIDQLLAIEARPKELVQQRNAVLTSQQVAFQDVNARLLSLKLSSSAFSTDGIFNSTSATSSNESVLTATSTNSAVPGSYSFTVDRLVTTQQIITNGFTDQDSDPIAPAGGTLSFEFGDARLDADTELAQLNGGLGITRGKVRVTDRSGASAVIDLSKSLKVNDVLDAINTASGINVTASVNGDGFQIIDNTGGGGTLAITDIASSGTTASLGLNTAAVGDTLTGSQVNRIGTSTSLTLLNDGNGVRIRAGVDDFQVTRRDGTTFNVDLENAATVGNVIDAINTASGGNVTASINPAGTGLQLVDTTGSTATNLSVTAQNSSNAAADLGILGAVGSDTLTGGRVVASLNSKLIGNLNGGSGVTLGTIDITNRLGNTFVGLDLTPAESVADVLDIINNAGHGVTASLNTNGTGILITDTTGSTASDLIIADNTGTAATDLNIAGTFAANTTDSGNLQLRYISEATRLDALNGGLGVSSGRFTIIDSSGASSTVDLSQGENTIQEVLSEINSRPVAVNARINDNGDGILIEDTGPGTSPLEIREAGSTTARDLGILGVAENPGDDINGSFEKTFNIGSVISLTGATALSALNGGEGVSILSGQDDLSIITQDGNSHNINLDGLTTVNDVINAISTGTGGLVTATINTTQTGLTLTDGSSGSATFEVLAANDSGAAADLGIAGSDDDGNGVIPGGQIIEITTLQDLASQINDAGIGVAATIINDGSSGSPFRLSIQSQTAGRAGSFIFDDGGLGFGSTTLTEAQDAVAFFGSPDPAKAIAITSSSNSLQTVIPGATIDLVGTSDSPVQVTINRDESAIIDAVSSFVDGFNDLMSTIGQLDSFNAETEQRGLLLGDATLANIQSSLFRLVNSRNNDLSSQFVTMAQIGITVRSGNQLRFDESRFLSALASDPDAVEQMFTFKETETDPITEEISTTAAGTFVKIDELLENITNSQTGVLSNRVSSISALIELNDRRIEQFDVQLENKRERLQFQFLSMELALAELQGQNTSLASLGASLQLATGGGTAQ